MNLYAAPFWRRNANLKTFKWRVAGRVKEPSRSVRPLGEQFRAEDCDPFIDYGIEFIIGLHGPRIFALSMVRYQEQLEAASDVNNWSTDDRQLFPPTIDRLPQKGTGSYRVQHAGKATFRNRPIAHDGCLAKVHVRHDLD